MKRTWKRNTARGLKLLLVLVLAVFAVGCSQSPASGPSNRTSYISENSPHNGPVEASASAPISTTSVEKHAEGDRPFHKEEVTGKAGNTSATPEDGSEKSTFEVHFIDVGQADATLVLCDGHAMLIDGGNAADSDLIFTYLKKRSLNHLDYMVCTHAHEDHVGGLSGALNYATVDVAFSPVTSYDSKAFGNYVSYLSKQGLSITVPSAGESFSLGSASVHVLGPISSSSDPNNTSIVLRVVYGETSFLLTGDAEREEELEIISAGYELDSTVLKVGHHGSDTSTSYVFLREIMPEYAVIPVGNGNSYGHPSEAVLSRLRDADVKLFRTDLQGDIICSSDGKGVSFTVERNAGTDTLAAVGPNSQQSGGIITPSNEPDQPKEAISISDGANYILNSNSYKFHYPDCSSVAQMAEHNKQAYNGTRDEAIAMGYSPCGRCHP